MHVDETGADGRLCGGRCGTGSCWHLHIVRVGHVWEIARYRAIAGRIGSARFFNEHLAVNIVCCPVLIPEHMGAPFALLRASPIIGLAPFTFCRSEEHTSELQSLMRISYAVFCLKKTKKKYKQQEDNTIQITTTPTSHTSYRDTQH